MGTTALTKISSSTALRSAWADITFGRRNRPTFGRVGIDGQSLSSFGARLPENIGAVQINLRDPTFQFFPLQPSFVPKGNGSDRLICIPVVKDRLIQRSILNFLRPKNGWMANGMSFGFVPDLSVNQAVDRAIKLRRAKPWVFKTDITAFFDMIDRTILLERLEKKVRHKTIMPLLRKAVVCEIDAPTEPLRKKLKATNIREGRGVRQGMPLSPYFANVMLEQFDKSCIQAGFEGVRYADDLAFFAQSEEQAKNIGEFCRIKLAELNLGIPELVEGSKTQIYSPNEAADFLGVELAPVGQNGYELRISSAQMTKIKDRIHQFGNLRELESRNLDISRFGNALEATVRSYAASYEHCANHADLLNHMESCRKNAIENSMKQLGLDVNSLSKVGRWFLGLS